MAYYDPEGEEGEKRKPINYYDNLVTKVERLIENIVNQAELKDAVECFNAPFVLFHYPGGLSYELKPDGKLHCIKESCDQGVISLSAVARHYVNKLAFYDIDNRIKAEIGSSAEELTRKYKATLDSGRLPEGLRQPLGGR